MKIIERIAQFIDYKNISHNEFDKIIGASNGYIGKLIRNKGSIGGDTIEKIVSQFKELNPDWLITGEGKMLRNTDHFNGNFEDQEIRYRTRQDFLDEIKKLNADKKKLEKEMQEKDKEIKLLKDGTITLQNKLIKALMTTKK